MNNRDILPSLEEANLRWNFTVNVLDVAFFLLALSMVSQTTILPLLVRELTDSPLAIGLIPAIAGVGYLLPQLLIANYAEGLRRKKRFIQIISGIGERGPYLATGLLVLALGERAPAVALAGFFVLLTVTNVAAGLGTPPWYDLIAKAIPANRRGLWAGVSRGLGSLLGIGGAALAGRFLAEYGFPRGFAFCYFAASAALAVSFVALSLNREPESTVTKPRVRLPVYLRQLPTVLRRDANYLRYLIARSVAGLGAMGTGFFMVYGADRFGVAGQTVGFLTGVLVGSQALGNLLLGAIADRVGHRTVLAFGALTMAAATISVLLAPSVVWLAVTFALVGLSTAAALVSGLNIILEFCAAEDRPTYIGLTNTLLAPATALAPLIGAWLATAIGYRGMFAVAVAVALTGGLLLAGWVREPRYGLRAESAPAA
ncbi:MAG: MFS transporter [Anaerolineae bacterium]